MSMELFTRLFWVVRQCERLVPLSMRQKVVKSIVMQIIIVIQVSTDILFEMEILHTNCCVAIRFVQFCSQKTKQ